MLAIKVTMMDGRTDAQKEELHRRLCELAVDRLGWSAADVRTVINEVPALHWGISGESVEQARGRG